MKGKDLQQYLPSRLMAGTHTVSYEALVVTSGDFSLPPAKAFVIEQPEVMGLSAGGKIRVASRT